MTNGPLAGCQLRELAQRHPEELIGRGWRGQCFPVLTKFIDASGGLPVHLHADDATAQRLEGQRNGKTEAWHILDAAPGATALCGIREGVSREVLHEALLAQDFDAVMRRLPVRAGDTIYVPGGTLHTFGPGTLVYEIEQTSNIQQHAMRWQMEDGSPLPDEQWHANLTTLLQEVKLDPKPEFIPGLRVPVDDAVDRVFLCAGPYFALERWRAGGVAPIQHSFSTAQILSNVGGPVRVHVGGWSQTLERTATLLLPAACGSVQIDGPADVLFGYLPDLDVDVFQPLLAAGYRPQAIASLGEGFDDLVEGVTASPADITPS
ncbi:class I mannose-6-phosphate isomerase [Micromonospora sp. NPDC000018]|uniref:class I mannose-6-phosphate isomerase n=1 Tax=Micromonospora sp. NPDC000018 TaxID=3154239 RepID=UPI00331E296A